MTTETAITVPAFLTPEQVCEIVPGITTGNLAQRRYKGLPPTFLRPSPRTILYKRDDIIAWVEGSARNSTAEDN